MTASPPSCSTSATTSPRWWGYVVRAVLEELGETHVIGLTATPPAELTGAETELYGGLLGAVDFEIPTPGGREGRLPRA